MCCSWRPPSAGVCAGESTTLPAGSRQGESQRQPPESVGQGGCGQRQDGPSGPRLSLETQCPLQLSEVGGRIGVREPALLPKMDSRVSHTSAGMYLALLEGQAGQRSAQPASPWARPSNHPRPRLTLPGRNGRPGRPAAPTPAARAPGAGAAHTPSAPAGQRAGGTLSLHPGRPAPCPSPPFHTHLLPGEGRDQSQAASRLQLLPLGLPVEVLVPPAASEEQHISWGWGGREQGLSLGLHPWSSAGRLPAPDSAHRSRPGPLAPGWLLGRGLRRCRAPP